MKATNVLATVNRLRQELAFAYGKKDLLSAATKLLWLLHRHLVVIYDSQVRAALGAPPGDYATYLTLWNARYAELEPQIRRAVARLSEDSRVPSQAEWFRRRVLDIHLWRQGAPR